MAKLHEGIKDPSETPFYGLTWAFARTAEGAKSLPGRAKRRAPRELFSVGVLA